MIRDEFLLCIECGRACPCGLYTPHEPHVHLPGGDDRYPLCDTCEERFLERHRPVHDGKWRWLKTCRERCLYDHIQRTVSIRDGLAREERS